MLYNHYNHERVHGTIGMKPIEKLAQFIQGDAEEASL